MLHDSGKLNDQVRRVWDTNADHWDSKMGEGNEFHELLIKPAQLKFLDICEGDSILDIACGNGQFSRTMAEFGANVLATDISPFMIRNAQKRTSDKIKNLSFRVLDATDHSALVKLGERTFDSVVCTMALFDISNVEPLIRSISDLIKPEGKFVFSILHPAFNSPPDMSMSERRIFSEGRTINSYSVNVSKYRSPAFYKSVAMDGQPELQLVFHRSMTDLFNMCFDSGLVIDGFDEPTFGGKIKHANNLSWFNLDDIPPDLICRIRNRNRS